MLTDMRLFVQSILGPPVKQGHKWWTWHCRVNKPDRRPSLKVESQGFMCFSCGVGGKPYHFLVKEMGYSPEAAKAELGYKSGARPWTRRGRVITFEVGISPPSPEWRQVFEGLLRRSQEELHRAERYLASRGITMETAVHFELGYVPVWFPVPDFETWLAPGVVIPAFAGHLLWSLEVRVLEGPLKYHRPKGVSEPVPFGLVHLMDRDVLVITEGSFDALAVWQVAGDYWVDVLALRGAHNSLRFWQGYLAGYPRIVVATDGDQAGDKVAQDLRAQHPTWERRRPPDGMDLNDMLLAGTLSKGWLLGDEDY